jgi:ferredoxin
MMVIAVIVLAVILVATFQGSQAFRTVHSGAFRRTANTQLKMGFMDALNKALANDPNIGNAPVSSPGLSKAPEPVEVEFLPSKKKVKAYPGQKLSMIANTAGVEIKYKCKKGDCGTCTVNFNGVLVKACQSSLPSSIAPGKKFTIGVPSK